MSRHKRGNQKQRGRRVPARQGLVGWGTAVQPVRPGERSENTSGALLQTILPQQLQIIQVRGKTEQDSHGRGCLECYIQYGILLQSNYTTLQDFSRTVPGPYEQDSLGDLVSTYDMTQQVVLLVIDVSPGLPGPQVWFQPIALPVIDIPPVNILADLFVDLEVEAKQGFLQSGRGAVFVIHVVLEGERVGDPFIKYVAQSDESWVMMAADDEIPRMVETYDPVSQMVCVEGQTIMDDGQLVDIQAAIWDFIVTPLPPGLTPSA